MSLQQELNEYQAREDAQAALDARIDEATTEGLSTMSEVELLNALTEIDVDGKAKPDSPEDCFHDILIWIRGAAQKEQAKGALPKNDLEKALYRLVWKSHRRFEVEPGWVDD